MTQHDKVIADTLRRESAEVYYTKRSVGTADDGVIDFLKSQAAVTPRKRCRLCLHPSPEAAQQEMVIVMHRDSYVPPHMHTGKGETFLVLEGEATTPVYDSEGRLLDVMLLGPHGSGRTFFYRMPETVYHGLIIETPWLVYVETTIGPFSRAATTFPTWAPDGTDAAAVAAYNRRQALEIATFRHAPAESGPRSGL